MDWLFVDGVIGLGAPSLAFITAVFLLGGLVKGVISFGLPLVTVPLLSQIFPVPVAITLSLTSVVVSSLVQASLARRSYPVLARVWPLLLSLAAVMPLSAGLAAGFEPASLWLTIGVFIEVLVAVQWVGLRSPLPQRNRALVLTAGGALSGLFGGLTSFYSFPSVQLLVGMRLTAAEFVFATNILFLVGSACLGSSLGALGLFTPETLAMSLWALAPLMLGLAAGQRLRRHISQERFRRLVLLMLAATGLSLINRGLGG